MAETTVAGPELLGPTEGSELQTPEYRNLPVGPTCRGTSFSTAATGGGIRGSAQ